MLRAAVNILWPSFLIAIVGEGCFFSLFEPHELLQLTGLRESPPIAGYTIIFFFFWSLCALASSLTYYLANVEKNQ